MEVSPKRLGFSWWIDVEMLTWFRFIFILCSASALDLWTSSRGIGMKSRWPSDSAPIEPRKRSRERSGICKGTLRFEPGKFGRSCSRRGGCLAGLVLTDGRERSTWVLYDVIDLYWTSTSKGMLPAWHRDRTGRT